MKNKRLDAVSIGGNIVLEIVRESWPYAFYENLVQKASKPLSEADCPYCGGDEELYVPSVDTQEMTWVYCPCSLTKVTA